MKNAIQRILGSFLLLAIFGLALYLRFYGIDWAFKDGIYTHHPDESFYNDCANKMNPQWLTPEEQKLPWRDQVQILYEKNLHVKGGAFKPGVTGLRQVNYNYGSFPIFVYLLYRAYLLKHAGGDHSWYLLAPDWLGILAFVISLLIGIRLFLAVHRDFCALRENRIPLWKDEKRLSLLFPSLLPPIVGLILMIFMPQALVNFSQYTPGNSILIISRIITAWAGAFTVLLVYLIGRDAYNRTVGLLAAMMLACAMLHVQLSHFATVDIIIGFWSTAAVYCFLKISQKPKFIWYVLSAICMGFAVSTKWSGVLLPGFLLVAHAVATWGDERTGKLGRIIHSVWLSISGVILLHFFRAAQSTNPPLNITLASFRDFYVGSWFWKEDWRIWLPIPKIWLLLLIAALIILSLIAIILRRFLTEKPEGLFRQMALICRPWLWLAIAIPIGVLVFYIGEPMAYFDAQVFGQSIAEQAGINVTGDRPVPYTLQFRHTSPIFCTLDNLFYPSLDYLTAFFVVAGCIYASVRIFYFRTAADFLLSIYVIPCFILYSSFASKFPRYITPILPVMMVLGGRLLADLCAIQPSMYVPALPRFSMRWKRFAKSFGMVGGSLALLCGLIYGWSYVRIYDKPHTLVTTGELMRQYMKPGASVTQNSWDEGFGIDIPGEKQLTVHADPGAERNPAERIRYLVEKLVQNDYIVFPSKRGYGSTLQNPELFPITNQFLKALFAEQLGYRIASVVTNYPRFWLWEFRTDEEDETADIYDHPKVVIFEKIQKFKKEQYQELITNPPEWVNRITAQEILSVHDGYPVFAAPPNHPIIRWWFIVQWLGWVAFLLLFPLCSRLPDRGYGTSKAVGITVFSWLCWFLASTHILYLSQMQSLVVLLLLTAAASWVWMKYQTAIRGFLIEKWPLLLGMEAVYLLIWGIFLIIRAYHPAAIWGEKPMNFSFINATYRTATFPPEDPWISDFPINYYYYGHAVYSIIGRFIGLPPEYLFNIAGAGVTALVGLGIFSLTYALCRKWGIGLLAAYLAVFSGHLISYANLLRYELRINELSFWKIVVGVGAILKWMYCSLMIFIGRADPAMIEQARNIDYHITFWLSGHEIFKGTAACEFPYWMHLFMDFHAHMLVIPFTIAFLILLYAYFTRPRAETNFIGFAGFSVILGILLGTVICTNTWDFPGLLIALLVATAVKFVRESEWIENASWTKSWLQIEFYQSLARFPVLPTASILLLGYFLFFPFHHNFISRVTGIGWMAEGNTSPAVYFGYWGHLIIPSAVAVILLAITRSDGKFSFSRTTSFWIYFAAFLSLALGFTTYVHQHPEKFADIHRFPFYYFPTHVHISGERGLPMDYTMVGLLFPLLTVLFIFLWKRTREAERVFGYLIGFLALGISLGIEFFYMKEGWSEPDHRWNTVFKFNIQVWHYLSVFAALSCLWVWRRFRSLGKWTAPWVRTAGRTGFVLLCTPLFLASIPFAVIGPIIVTQTGRALGQDARGFIPTQDGLSWLRKERYDAYAGIQWFNRFVPGTPNIVELSDRAYLDFSRFCTNTGLPALIGWDHHVGERMHHEEKVPRMNAVERIYLSPNKEEVMQLIGTYRIEYLVFGDLEMNRKRGDRDMLPPLGKRSLSRFEEWGDVFRLVYRLGEQSIFKIDKNLNRAYGMRVQAETPTMSPENLPPALRRETGNSMFEGGRGSDNGYFQEPRGIVEDATGQVYVADTRNHRIQVFKPDGSFAWKVGEEGTDAGQFKEPNTVAINPSNGSIYVADTWNHRIVLLNSTGVFQGAIALGFFGPRGIVFHPQNQLLYLTDTGNHLVKAVTLDGQPVQVWGEPGGGSGENAFREPVGIALQSDGNLVVVDSRNRRLKIYTPDGKLVRVLPIQTEWKGESGGFEGHVACDPDGTLYVTDHNERDIHVYNATGALVEKIHQDVTGVALVQPVGITYTRNGQVLVSDLSLNRILRVK